jgi:hypothetical protein
LQFFPRAVRANGHLLINSAKMSKSTGNFKTLQGIRPLTKPLSLAEPEFGFGNTRPRYPDIPDGLA